MEHYFKTKHSHIHMHMAHMWLSNYHMVCNLTLRIRTQLIYHLVDYFAWIDWRTGCAAYRIAMAKAQTNVHTQQNSHDENI